MLSGNPGTIRAPRYTFRMNSVYPGEKGKGAPGTTNRAPFRVGELKAKNQGTINGKRKPAKT
jgi:hypothetical protein